MNGPVADDVATPSDEAPVPYFDHRIAQNLLTFGHSCGHRGIRTDDRVAADSDAVLVEDGALGKDETAAPPECPESARRSIVGPHSCGNACPPGITPDGF